MPLVLEALVLATLLHTTDPAGDALGAGALTPPTATLFRDRDSFDLRGVELGRSEEGTLNVRLGLGAPPENFPTAITELYIGSGAAPGGVTEPSSEQLLSASGFRFPEGQSWRYALRIVGTEVRLYRATKTGTADVTKSSLIAVQVQGDTLNIATRLGVPEALQLYGLKGAFDPFSASGWRDVRPRPSPWGFSGQQTTPVLDVLAPEPALQQRAFAQLELPQIRATRTQPGWLALAIAGASLSLLSLMARYLLASEPRLKPSPTKPTKAPATPALIPLSLRRLNQNDLKLRSRLLKAHKKGSAWLALGDDLAVPEDGDALGGSSPSPTEATNETPRIYVSHSSD